MPGTPAAMCPGVPYAISAKFAHPDRPVIGFTGDGAFQMLGMNELLTVNRYLPQLMAQEKTLIFVVLSNDDLNQVSMEQRVLGADPKNPETQTLPYLPAADYARMLGFEGIKVEKPGDVGAAWDRALAAGKPVLLEFMTDPQIAALPPHVKPTMMKKVAKALAKGDEDAVGIAEKGVKGKLSEVTEHVKDKLSRD